MDNKILVTNIQRFSLHDGPGIRTTVFLKGCALQCPWCANPENISKLPQSYTKDGETGMYGKYMGPHQLFDELMRDRMFFCDGGVTFSGGEPLLQMSVLEPVLRLLKENDIHICMETSLFAPSAQLEIALNYVDLFYVDCKLADPKGWQTVLRGDLTQYLKNIHRLFQTNIPRIFRIPIIGGYTDTEEAMTQILDLIDTYRPDSAELLIGHNLGAKKYVSLGLTPPVISDVQPEFLEQYLKHLQQKGICAKICRI